MKKAGRHHSGQGINGNMSNKTKRNHAPPWDEHGITSAIVTAKGAQPEPNHEETIQVEGHPAK